MKYLRRKFALSLLTSLLASTVFTSCVNVHGDASKGTYTMSALGTDLKGYAQTAQGVAADSIDNSTSFRSFSDTVRKMVYAQMAAGTLKNMAAAYKSIANTKTTAEVAKVKAVEVTKRTAISADAATQQAQIQANAAQGSLDPGFDF